MAWNYSGNPASSELDEYRFLIGDVLINEPVLQDEEIQYIISTYANKNARLSKLYESAANSFSRDYKKSLGPQAQDPTSRLDYFNEKAKYYKTLCAASGLSQPVYSAEKIFVKGMHDNV